MVKPEILKPVHNGDMPQVSAPDDFDYDKPMLVRLTTGRVIEMVLGEIEMFLQHGEIPNELIGIATRQLLPSPDKETDEQAAKRIMERLQMAEWTAAQVVKRGGPIERFAKAEIWEVYNLANNPAMLLANFRLQQRINVDLLAQQQAIGLVAEPATASAE